MGRKLQFEWDSANVGHILRHRVTPEEVEDLFSQPTLTTSAAETEEPRIVEFGKTKAGRYLVVVYTARSGRVRVVTAFPMKRKFRRMYEEAIKHL